MKKLRIGVVGAGLIGQVEHIPNLLRMANRFELAGVADASPKMRAALAGRGLKAFPDHRALLECDLDALLVAAPDQYHAEMTLAALERGLHVFCEKPLCFSVAEAQEIARARDKAGRVVQVGYMKRFDPNYEHLRRLLPRRGAGLRFISVEVQDPDFWPFNQHQGEFVKSDDVPRSLIEEGRARMVEQVRRATGHSLDGAALRGFTNSYCSSLIHDINAVHGLLELMEVGTGPAIGAAFFAGGDGGHGSLRLEGADAIWQMTHLFVPQVADYRERVTLYFDDAVFELTFPSPYLNHFPTRLHVARSEGNLWQKTEYRASYEEAFQRELIGFWSSVVEGAPARNTVEEAIRDLDLCARLAESALGQPSAARPRT